MSNNIQNQPKFQIINLYTHNITWPFRHARSIPFASMLDSRQITVVFEKFNKMLYVYMLGYAVARLVEALSYKPKGRGFDSRCVTGIFHWHNPSRPNYGPGVDLACNRNENHKYFLGGRGGRCVRLTILPHSRADCFENLKPQRPGTLRTCPGV